MDLFNLICNGQGQDLKGVYCLVLVMLDSLKKGIALLGHPPQVRKRSRSRP